VLTQKEGQRKMSKHALGHTGNTLFGLVFLVIAIVEYVSDSSGIGLVFLMVAGVFVALQFRERRWSN
jgi:uncharacterized membrane protein